MPVPYNKNHTTYKSTALQGLDCNVSSGPVYHAGITENFRSFAATFTAAEAIEAGECVAMIRVPRGLTVTDVAFFITRQTAAIVGVGDPFCCGRFLGPIDAALLPNDYIGQAQTVNCTPLYWRLTKIGRGGDGCGFGYTYTCDTDVLVTNGYGVNTFQQGGGSVGGASMGGTTPNGTAAGPIASGTVLGLKIEGYMNPELTNG